MLYQRSGGSGSFINGKDIESHHGQDYCPSIFPPGSGFCQLRRSIQGGWRIVLG